IKHFNPHANVDLYSLQSNKGVMISQTEKWLVPLASQPNEEFIALLDQVNIGSHQKQTSKVREAKLYALITVFANKEGVSAQDRNTMHVLGYEFLYGTNAV